MGTWKRSCSKATQDRITRALTERLYLVNRTTVEKTEAEKELENAHHCEFSVPKQEFHVLGSTGNLYTVTIYLTPKCSCPDFGKGHFCKHILFVYLKVLKVPPDSNLLYQSHLLSSELVQINTSNPVDPTVLADQNVRTEFARIATVDNGDPTTKQKPVEGQDCPVCFEQMTGSDQVEFCTECGNNVHKVCWQKWSETKRNMKVQETCIWCRAVWGAAKTTSTHASGDYINLGRFQPITDTILEREDFLVRRRNTFDPRAAARPVGTVNPYFVVLD